MFQALDVTLATGDAQRPALLHHLAGDDCSPRSFMPLESPLPAGGAIRLAPQGGRSSNGTFPFFIDQQRNKTTKTLGGRSLRDDLPLYIPQPAQPAGPLSPGPRGKLSYRENVDANRAVGRSRAQSGRLELGRVAGPRAVRNLRPHAAGASGRPRGDAEIVLINKTVLAGKRSSGLPRLKYVGVLATGYNIVDIEAARQRGSSLRTFRPTGPTPWRRWSLRTC